MNAHTNLSNTYLTVEQVAERYKVSTDSIWRWKRKGEFPAAVRVGPNCTRWRLADLTAYEESMQACMITHADWLIAA